MVAMRGTSGRSRANRVTHKTKLHLLLGDFDVQPIVLGEEDEKEAQGLSTHGVDAEDANEHHLQAVLCQQSLRQQLLHEAGTRTSRSSRHDPKDQSQPLQPEAGPSAYIPTPAANGVAQNVDSLYPSGVFKDTALFMKFSETVEECVRDGLNGERASYYLDEQDKAWLDARNAQAIQAYEALHQPTAGTSASAVAAQSAGGSPAKATTRSASLKGKERDTGDLPTSAATTQISEDELEFVMGIFEMYALRHCPHLEVDFRSTNLPPLQHMMPLFRYPQPDIALFAQYRRPAWMHQDRNAEPPYQHLMLVAQVVYHHWCTRRIQRRGRTIMPSLLCDETAENENDDYLCFRRRENKPVRKARKHDNVTGNRMLDLQNDMAKVLQLAKDLLTREKMKRDVLIAHKELQWARLEMVGVKRKFGDQVPWTPEDDTLVVERNKRPKTAKPTTIAPAAIIEEVPVVIERSPTPTPPVAVVVVPPRVALTAYNRQIEELAKAIDSELEQRRAGERDWEDALDATWQPVRPAKRGPTAAVRPVVFSDGSGRAGARRLRMGRGGRLHLDRVVVPQRAAIERSPSPSTSASSWGTSSLFSGSGASSSSSSSRVPDEDEERLRERWKYDFDGPMHIDVDDDMDRALIDDDVGRLISQRSDLLTADDLNETFIVEHPAYPQPQPKVPAPVPISEVRIANARRVSITTESADDIRISSLRRANANSVEPSPIRPAMANGTMAPSMIMAPPPPVVPEPIPIAVPAVAMGPPATPIQLATAVVPSHTPDPATTRTPTPMSIDQQQQQQQPVQRVSTPAQQHHVVSVQQQPQQQQPMGTPHMGNMQQPVRIAGGNMTLPMGMRMQPFAMNGMQHVGVNGMNAMNGVNGMNAMNGVNGMSTMNGVNGMASMNGMTNMNGVNGMNGMQHVNGNAAAMVNGHAAMMNGVNGNAVMMNGVNGQQAHPQPIMLGGGLQQSQAMANGHQLQAQAAHQGRGPSPQPTPTPTPGLQVNGGAAPQPMHAHMNSHQQPHQQQFVNGVPMTSQMNGGAQQVNVSINGVSIPMTPRMNMNGLHPAPMNMNQMRAAMMQSQSQAQTPVNGFQPGQMPQQSPHLSASSELQQQQQMRSPQPPTSQIPAQMPPPQQPTPQPQPTHQQQDLQQQQQAQSQQAQQQHGMSMQMTGRITRPGFKMQLPANQYAMAISQQGLVQPTVHAQQLTGMSSQQILDHNAMVQQHQMQQQLQQQQQHQQQQQAHAQVLAQSQLGQQQQQQQQLQQQQQFNMQIPAQATNSSLDPAQMARLQAAFRQRDMQQQQQVQQQRAMALAQAQAHAQAQAQAQGSQPQPQQPQQQFVRMPNGQVFAIPAGQQLKLATAQPRVMMHPQQLQQHAQAMGWSQQQLQEALRSQQMQQMQLQAQQNLRMQQAQQQQHQAQQQHQQAQHQQQLALGMIPGGYPAHMQAALQQQQAQQAQIQAQMAAAATQGVNGQPQGMNAFVGANGQMFYAQMQPVAQVPGQPQHPQGGQNGVNGQSIVQAH